MSHEPTNEEMDAEILELERGGNFSFLVWYYHQQLSEYRNYINHCELLATDWRYAREFLDKFNVASLNTNNFHKLSDYERSVLNPTDDKNTPKLFILTEEKRQELLRLFSFPLNATLKDMKA